VIKVAQAPDAHDARERHRTYIESRATVHTTCMVGLIVIDRCAAERRFVSRPHGSTVPHTVVIVLVLRGRLPRLALSRNEVTAARVEQAETST
jgi:hypothetical protein